LAKKEGDKKKEKKKEEKKKERRMDVIGARYGKWAQLNRAAAEFIFFILYKGGDASIGAARDIIGSSVFSGKFTYDWCPDIFETTYDRTIGSLIKSTGKRTKGKMGDCGVNVQDEDQSSWMRHTMQRAIDWYLCFGMCPFRLVIDETSNPRVIIPEFESGNFIARIDKKGILEVAWISYQSMPTASSTADLKPDSQVGVHVWSDYTPSLGMEVPYNSIVNRLRADYIRLLNMHQNLEYADIMASMPPIVTRSDQKPRSVETLSMDEVLGDGIAFDPGNQTINDREMTRINDSSIHRTDALREYQLEREYDAGSMGSRPKVHKLTRHGALSVESSVSPWLLVEHPLDNGRNTASIQMPARRNDALNWQQWWDTRVSTIMGVPMGVLNSQGRGGNKTATEAETSNSRFRDFIAKVRESITEFLETAWARGMGRIEEDIINGKLEQVLAEKQHVFEEREAFYNKGKRKRTKALMPPDGDTSIDEKKNKKDTKRSRRKSMPTTEELEAKRIDRWERGEIPGVESPEDLERSVFDARVNLAVEAEADKLMRRAQSLHVPVEPSTLYSDVEDIVRRNAPEFSSNSEYLRIDRKRYRMEQEKRQAEILAEKEADLVETETNLRSALSTRKRLKLFWTIPPAIEQGDIIALYDKGIIDLEATHAMIVSKIRMPIDTPMGMSQEERLLRVKAELDMKLLREKSRFEMGLLREKSRFEMEKVKETSAFQLKALKLKSATPSQPPMGEKEI
jgi:hypothetical protein